MKKFTSVTLMGLIYLLNSSLTFAQLPAKQPFTNKYDSDDDGPKGWIGFAIGPCFPVGAIANTDPLSEDAGFATTGIHLNLNLGYRIAGPVGLSVLFHTNINKINEDAFGKLLSAGIPNGYSGSYVVKPWHMSGLLAGPYVNLISNGSAAFYIRGLIGFANVTNPETSITISKSGYQPVTGTTEAAEFMGFGYSLGSGANIRLGKKVQLMLNVDFISTSVTIEGLKTSYSNGAPYTVSNSYRQPYSVVNVTGGIGYVIQ